MVKGFVEHLRISLEVMNYCIFTSSVAQTGSWFCKAKALESSKSKWKHARSGRGQTLLSPVECISDSGPSVFSEHFPASNCILPERGHKSTWFHRGRPELQRPLIPRSCRQPVS